MAVLTGWAILLALVVATLVYLIVVTVYRLTLHPLATVPGPFLARITQWPEAISASRGNRHVDLQLLHEKYGDVVRISPNALSFRKAEALHDIYGDRKANVIKTGWTGAALAINPGYTTHNMSDRALHTARRRLLSQAFSENALKSLETFVVEQVRVWCDHLGELKSEKSDWSEKKNMGLWSTLLTVDVLGELCFGANFGAMMNGGHLIIRLLMATAKFFQSVAFNPMRTFLFPILRNNWIVSKVGGQIAKDKVAYRETVAQYVAKRFQLEGQQKEKPQGGERKDFFHYLLRAKDPETSAKFNQKDLIGEAALLVAAGSDTSSTALAACFFYLTRSPQVLKRLQDHVRGAFSDVEKIRSGEKLSSLAYLRACIDEAMRMTPPVPDLLSRLILPGGQLIDGTHYPEGTVVGVPIYALHHNEKYFPESFSYIPERWIEGCEGQSFSVTKGSIETSKRAFAPFQVGPRNCVGKNMAYMELLIAVARVIFLFDMRLTPGDHSGDGGPDKGPGRQRRGEYQTKDWLISERDGPVMEFKRREPAQAATQG